MARRVRIVLVDDLTGEENADETVRFALDGTTYEIDLTTKNAGKLRDALAAYVGAARKVAGFRGSGGRKATQANNSGLSKADRDAVREWSRTAAAKSAGIEPLGNRGRIPEAAAAAWRAP